MRAAGVTYEAVKRQLELLGHDVPDDAIHAYLKDLQKGSTEAPSSSRPGSQLSERPTYVPARQEPREGGQRLDDLCDRFEATLNPGGAAAAASRAAALREHDSCQPSLSNPRATGPLVSEEVMTRAESILKEHHTSHTYSVPRYYAPASGTLQPRATTNSPDLDEPPANIAPDGFASRYNHAHPDPYYARPSTANPSRRSPHDSYRGPTARRQPGARPSSRPATAGEAAQNTWRDDDDYDRDYEYGGDSGDEMHEYHAQKPPLRGQELSARMHAHVYRHTQRNMHQKNTTSIDSPDDDECEDYKHPSHQEDSGRHRKTLAKRCTIPREEERMHGMHSTDARWGHACTAGVSRAEAKRDARVNSTRVKQAPRHRDLSPFDANVEDNDREWENVLLEATGGAEVGLQAGQRRSGGGEASVSGVKGAGDGNGDAWGGFSNEWGGRGTERSYSHTHSQVHHPHQHRPRTPLVANNSYIVGRSNLSGAARPIDRVARFQQLNKQWTKDRFLTKAKGQALGYQEAFERSHRREKVDLQHLKETNKARPATASSTAGKSFVPPGQKRRDKLRWSVRQRMQWQD